MAAGVDGEEAAVDALFARGVERDRAEARRTRRDVLRRRRRAGRLPGLHGRGGRSDRRRRLLRRRLCRLPPARHAGRQGAGLCQRGRRAQRHRARADGGRGHARRARRVHRRQRREARRDRVSSRSLAPARREARRWASPRSAPPIRSSSAPPRATPRALRYAADRSDLQPGQPVRRLHRHAAGRFRRALVQRIAAEERLPADRIILGGDHLGPNPWRSEDCRRGHGEGRRRWSRPMLPPASARSISMPRWAAPASRRRSTTRRPPSAPRAWPRRQRGRRAPPAASCRVYIIGTEVPPPGGADHVDHRHRADQRRGCAADHRHSPRHLPKAGLAEAFSRVIGARRPARRRVRQRERHALRSGEGARADAVARPGAWPRLRGAFDRLPGQGALAPTGRGRLSRSSRSVRN